MGRVGAGVAARTAAAGPLLLLMLLLARPPPAAAGDSKKSGAGLVSEHFSQAPQKLSFYSWYGSTRLFHFRVPPDTVLLRWLLHVSQGGPSCTDVEITVHFRYGAPPVINPLGTSFPDNTLRQASFYIRTLLSTMILGNTSVNISHPAPGDWFVVAHLPPSSQKIEVKGSVPTCAYTFQPDMLAMRVVEVSILEPDVPLPQTLLSHPSYLKIFVPEYTQELHLELRGCVSSVSPGCPVRLTVGGSTLPRNFQKVLSCTGLTPSCHLLLSSPPWGRWLQMTIENLAGPHVSVVFTAEAAFTVCRPWSVTFHHHMKNNPNQSYDTSVGRLSQNPTQWGLGRSGRVVSGPFCLLNYPVMREDTDVVSVHFQPLNGAFILVYSHMPSVMQLRLDTGMDSGGSLIIILRVNQTEVTNDTLVAACVNAASPFLSFNTSLNCTTAFFQGHPMFLSSSSHTANLIIPYPETDNWYLSLQLVCPESSEDCEQAIARVETILYLVPCLNDCGPYGQCLLLRRYGYLYAGCSCKAGWRGWSCTDNSTAQTVAQQKAAALLLTLSNLMFLAPIAVSVHRSFLVEASVYFYTMFFSTFYHACDQPGDAALCILSYDTLQYCDFLGSGAATWVTILCMARLKTILKQVLFVLGILVIAMSLQMDRRGIWNLMGPCLFAFVIMASMWMYRCGHRRQCYPTTWHRWVFYLLPGISMASVGITIYTSMMTSENYYYTHSIWHTLLAGSAALLLPPREEQAESWTCLQKFPCHYQICRNDRDELYTVT
ncbi:post-GPI attachment to proteins factor 6 isoform X2 [Phodopus roborovskii]|uniref:Tmem8 protein n=1 Tax=Phodopus roborovskii TaxID=109678 RepID=A0AAU9Z5P9_PHORO|nr:post-GPI attachment to proteins factor 6 isoform X2 [Phodopus roborovskii]CAH6786570.1 Tmem8 [Phodopus roborovskii]